MKKVSDVVRDIVIHQPFLEEALSHGFLNLTAFAEYIRPYIMREIQKEISVHAIKMSLSRLEKPRQTGPLSQYMGFQNISTRKGLSIMTIARSPKNVELTSSLMIDKRKTNASFFTVIEGVREIDIIFESGDVELLREKIPSSSQILTVSGLGLISCELSDAEISTPGLFYRVTKKLAFHGINIIQVLSTYHELGVIIREADIKNSMTILLD